MTTTDERKPHALAPASECRAWCVYPGTHWIEDRGTCCGEERELRLTREMTTTNHEVGLPEEPLKISVFAGAESVEEEPYVELSRDCMRGERLTVAEARVYAAHIIATCDDIEGVQS